LAKEQTPAATDKTVEKSPLLKPDLTLGERQRQAAERWLAYRQAQKDQRRIQAKDSEQDQDLDRSKDIA